MRFYLAISIGCIALLSAGCSVTVPCDAQLMSNSVKCQGDTTGYIDGSGDLNLQCNDGRVCTGNWTFVTGRTGSGVVKCTDGSTGTFDFQSSGSNGQGKGVINGEPFMFIFGHRATGR